MKNYNMNIFKKDKKKKEISIKTKKLKKWLTNSSKVFAFLSFTLFTAFLLKEPELILDRTKYFLYYFFNFSILLYLLTMLGTFFSYEIYNSVKDIFSKTSQVERDEILKTIRNNNPNLSKTEELCLEHIVHHDKKVSYLSILKKMEKIKP